MNFFIKTIDEIDFENKFAFLIDFEVASEVFTLVESNPILLNHNINNINADYSK